MDAPDSPISHVRGHLFIHDTPNPPLLPTDLGRRDFRDLTGPSISKEPGTRSGHRVVRGRRAVVVAGSGSLTADLEGSADCGPGDVDCPGLIDEGFYGVPIVRGRCLTGCAGQLVTEGPGGLR